MVLAFIVKHVFWHEVCEFYKLVVCKPKTCHEFVLVCCRWELCAHQRIYPCTLCTIWHPFPRRRLRWSKCDVRMWQSAMLELNDTYEISMPLLVVEFQIRRFVHRAAGCGFASKD